MVSVDAPAVVCTLNYLCNFPLQTVTNQVHSTQSPVGKSATKVLGCGVLSSVRKVYPRSDTPGLSVVILKKRNLL